MSSIPVQCVNEVISCKANSIIPKVGMLGTYFVGSDRYAVVVAKVISPKKIFILNLYNDEDTMKIIHEDGTEWLPEEFVAELFDKATPKLSWFEKYTKITPEEQQGWYEEELEKFNREHTYTYRKNNRWVEAGKDLWTPGAIHLGKADPYQDPSF